LLVSVGRSGSTQRRLRLLLIGVSVLGTRRWRACRVVGPSITQNIGPINASCTFDGSPSAALTTGSCSAVFMAVPSSPWMISHSPQSQRDWTTRKDRHLQTSTSYGTTSASGVPLSTRTMFQARAARVLLTCGSERLGWSARDARSGREPGVLRPGVCEPTPRSRREPRPTT
jgi:hypothetical protein